MENEILLNAWTERLKKIMGKKEMSLQEITRKLNESYVKVVYWTRILTLKGILTEKRKGKEKYLQFKK
jgi:hypothetical protein